jgi:hypothetical protein
MPLWALRHQVIPVLSNRMIDRQDPLGEACRQIVGEPGGQRCASAAIVHQSNATPKFSGRSDTDEHPVLVDAIKPAKYLQVGRW